MDNVTMSLREHLQGQSLMGFSSSRPSDGAPARTAKAAFVGEAADLQLAMSNSNPTPVVGDVVTITVEVGNLGPINYQAGAQIQDVLPSGLTFVSTSSSTGSYDPATNIWTSSVQIPVGVTQSFTIEARVVNPGEIVNTATLITSDANSNNDSASNTLNATCFATGARIRLLRDGAEMDVAVEALAVGDIAVTASRAHRPIIWIGHRVTDCRRHPRPREIMPVRIAAHAFAENRPARDLVVSPGHAICVDVVGEVLIPAGALVNGTTITQEHVDSVTYWHVELEAHDILLAENMPAESYLDMGNRGFFAESGVISLKAVPDAPVPTHADFCRPFHAEGALVDVVKAQTRERAKRLGWQYTSTIELHLEVDGHRVDPVLDGLTARFQMPADATDVWLVSPTARPCDIHPTHDDRDLGLFVGALRIEDGFAPRDIALDDPLLCIGFYPVEEGLRRWTTGRAKLPAALWADCEAGFDLHVDLATAPVPRWQSPMDAQVPLALAS